MNSRSSEKKMIQNKFTGNTTKEPVRKLPPTFPLGMRFGFARDVCILDFLDKEHNHGDAYCFYSVAITKTHAVEMVANLQKFIDSKGE